MINYCTIRHNIQGRIRVSLKKAYHDENCLTFIKDKIEKLISIDYVRINPKCNTIAVHYAAATLPYERAKEYLVEKINAFMHEFINQFSTDKLENHTNTEKNISMNYQQDKRVIKKFCAECAKSSLKKHSDTSDNLVRPAFRTFSLLSTVMGGVLIRRIFFGATIIQTPFSPLGLIAIGFSLPLLRNSYRQFKNKRFTLDGFLGAGAIAAVAAGEALTAFEILWINSGAELLTAWVTERSRNSISNILDLTSHHTFVLKDGVEIEIKVSDLKTGDIVVLHTGEKICIDGSIIDGEALIDESPISGRADFVPKNIDDTVLAGTFVRQGLIYVRADKVGDQTYLSRILCLVEDSLVNKAPVEALADKLAKNMIIFGCLATVTTFALTANLWRAFTVMLVMACPCATALAASTAVNASMNTAARKNILIKGGKYLEKVGSIDCVCFDKTGTLTSSEPRLSEIVLLHEPYAYINMSNNIKRADTQNTHMDTSESMFLEVNTPENISLFEAENALLQIVVSTEMHNHHPLAQAIKHEVTNRGIEPIPHSSCEYEFGMGMKATLNGYEVSVGNSKLMEKVGVIIDTQNAILSENLSYLQSRGRTVLFVAQDLNLVALLAFDNPIRPEAKKVIEILREKGIKHIHLITGDEENTAQTLSRELGIHDFHASVMPEEKAEIVKELQKKYKSVLMVGDGINDAMALSEANIGIAMGARGSEIAVEAADIILVNDDLLSIVYVYSLSKQTVKVVRQNFWIATGSNIVGLVLAASGFMPPVMAGMLHIVHTLGVLANSSRLLRYESNPIPSDKIIFEIANPSYNENMYHENKHDDNALQTKQL